MASGSIRRDGPSAVEVRSVVCTLSRTGPPCGRPRRRGGAAGTSSGVDLLQVERIDHRVRPESPALMARLAGRADAAHRLSLSNVKLCVSRPWPDHNLKAMLDAGIKVTIAPTIRPTLAAMSARTTSIALRQGLSRRNSNASPAAVSGRLSSPAPGGAVAGRLEDARRLGCSWPRPPIGRGSLPTCLARQVADNEHQPAAAVVVGRLLRPAGRLVGG